MVRKGGYARTRIVPKQERGVITTALSFLDGTRNELGGGPTRSDFERVHALLEQALTDPPNDSTLKEFSPHLKALFVRALGTFTEARKEYVALAPSTIPAVRPVNQEGSSHVDSPARQPEATLTVARGCPLGLGMAATKSDLVAIGPGNSVK